MATHDESAGNSATDVARSCTGDLGSSYDADTVDIVSLSVSTHDKKLLLDADLICLWRSDTAWLGETEMERPRTLLQVLANREVPIPRHVDICLVDKEVEPSECTALDFVLKSKDADLQKEIAHHKEAIEECGLFASEPIQARIRQHEQQLKGITKGGLIEEPYVEKEYAFMFECRGQLRAIRFSGVAFSYSGSSKDFLFQDISFEIDSRSRVALFGPSEAGKSMLVKLMKQELKVTWGDLHVEDGARIGHYHQHLVDELNCDKFPADCLEEKYAGASRNKREWRGFLGKFGISDDEQCSPVCDLSDGLKARIALAAIAMNKSHILLLDEPTSTLDAAGIDALAKAITEFKGGVVLVSHDFRLISKVVPNIWVVDGGFTRWEGDFFNDKESLKQNME